jgi:signal transduction histidine kinase
MATPASIPLEHHAQHHANGRWFGPSPLRAASLLGCTIALAAMLALGLQQEAAHRRADHAMAVHHAVGAVLAPMLRAETAARAWRINGDRGMLNRYAAARSAVAERLGRLRTLVAPDPTDLWRVAILASLIDQHLRTAASDIAGTGPNATRQVAASLGGDDPMALDRIWDMLRSLDPAPDRSPPLSGGIDAMLRRTLLSLAAAMTTASGILLAVDLRRDRRRLATTARAAPSTAEAMAAVYASAPFGLAVYDLDLRLMTLNQRFAAIAGRPPAALVGEPFDRAFPFAAGQDGAVLRGVIEHGRAVEGQQVTAPAAGTARLRDWLVSYHPVRRPDGRIIGVGCTVLDVTDLKQMEAQVRAEMATRDATHTHLLRSQRLDAVSQMAGGVAHNFNNLLGVILGNAEFLLDHMAVGSAPHGYAEEILSAAEEGAQLTHRMLAFGQRQPLHPALTDLNAELPAQVVRLRDLLGPAIEVTACLTASLWLTRVDAARVMEVLVDLAANARDAMPRGGRLTIRTENVTVGHSALHPESMAGDYVMVAVTDTGCGMPPEVLVRAAEPFFTTKGPDKGTGLGLSMCFGFAQQSGGYLSLASEPDSGTTVRLYLPRASRAAAGLTRSEPWRHPTWPEATLPVPNAAPGNAWPPAA